MDQSLSSSSITPSVLLTITLVLFVTLVIKSYKKYSKPMISKKLLPPGPWRLPFIGNLHQVISSSPHRQLATMAKKYGPFMHVQLGQLPYLVVSSADAALDVMKSHDLEFSGRPSAVATSILTYNYKDIAFAAYGDYLRWLRKLCAVDLLSAKRVQSFRYMREEEVSSMVESIRVASSSSSSQGSTTTTTVDVKEVLFALTSSITARTSLGKSSKERNAAYVPLVKRINEALGGFAMADFFPSIGFLPAVTGLKSRVLKLHREVDDVLQSIIDEHKSGERMVRSDGEAENLMDFLLDFQQHGGDRLEFPLTMDHIKAIIFDMFTAGIETSSTAAEWVMSELMANPTAMREVQSEIRQVFKDDHDKVDETRFHLLKYFDAVFKESLRLHPPFPLLPRKGENNVMVNGYEIPSETTILINLWAIGRDPKYWTDPENFRPERFLDNATDYKGTHFQFLPFGAGRRMCVGMQYGVTNVKVALVNLLYHFDWELPNGLKAENLVMLEAFGIAAGRKVPLHLKPIPWSSNIKTKW